MNQLALYNNCIKHSIKRTEYIYSKTQIIAPKHCFHYCNTKINLFTKSLLQITKRLSNTTSITKLTAKLIMQGLLLHQDYQFDYFFFSFTLQAVFLIRLGRRSASSSSSIPSRSLIVTLFMLCRAREGATIISSVHFMPLAGMLFFFTITLFVLHFVCGGPTVSMTGVDTASTSFD